MNIKKEVQLLVDAGKILFTPTSAILLLMAFVFSQYTIVMVGTNYLIVYLFMYLFFFGWLNEINHNFVMKKLLKIEKLIKEKNG